MNNYAFLEELKNFSVSDGEVLSQIALPDNSLHMVFHEGNEFVMTRKGTETQLSGNYLCGHSTIRKHFSFTRNCDISVLKFKPAANYLFQSNCSDAIDEHVSLSDFLPDRLSFSLESDLLSREEKIKALLNFLNQQQHSQKYSPGMFHAINRIEQCNGNLRVNNLADEMGYSRRNLERRFKEFTGITIKKFINNTRFQYAFNLLRQGIQSPDIVYSCGYFDQTHFIDEFRETTGVTPGQFAKKGLAENYFISIPNPL
ncbi:AraC-type DNA-binding protein [Pedobacter westerhofensis]|uniref:AraC-type DNA-binding protein n=1 Tax=Pedobacter westerhofensis TaxID=425512 RepID=A0A521ATL9_9SPHI|nr:helix-turn-helix domain-containing protein [Pedobacter westerhofensis]SMO38081.1 AraC-type DNA-binding protein [Pedobacter westerhofensis]